ncbi:MAG: SDR family NAD(P)-dependent oxidoreductase [Flavobacteriaceae bacterium]|nr:SDR family NAD(P)-dependent oxidoreductase [Flavobacteriaceae bacterium]
MKNKVLIITGGSKGIGKALANYYRKNNFKVYSLSRSVGKNLPFKQIKVNLVKDDIDIVFTSILNEINFNKVAKITLINNAGRLGEIGNLETIKRNDILNTIQLNITVPLQITSLFIEKIKSLNCAKTIINISSGAAINPYQGWSVYCTSKAAIDMMTKSIATEQEGKIAPVKCIGIRPGVVATAMQEQIRNTSKTDFEQVERFIAMYAKNQLADTKEVAKKIFKIDVENQVNSGETIALRDYS